MLCSHLIKYLDCLRNKMIELLKLLNLEIYQTLFEEEGIDDIETLKEFSEDELIVIGLKRGHIKKIFKAIEEDIDSQEEIQPTLKWYEYLCNDNSLWSDELLNSDIPVISHEYKRINDLLCQGQYFGVLLQIKDFFEILLKFPVLIIINEKFNSKNYSNKEMDFILSALEKPLSLGHWHELATLIDKNKFTSCAQFNKMLNNVIKLYNKNDIIKWRNDEIGHGALSLDDDKDFQEDIKSKLLLIKIFLDKNAEVLKAISVNNDNLTISYGNDFQTSLPFFNIINEKIYFFDSYLSRKQKTHQLNYCFGKKIITKVNDFDNFITMNEINNRDSKLSSSAVDDVRLAEEENKLDKLEESNDFIQPTYLINWLRESIEKFSKGKILLQMQRGTGKSLFCKALDQLALNKINLGDDILIRAYYINDIYRNSLSDFASEIGYFILNKKIVSNNLVDVFKGNLPDLTNESSKEDFAYMLNWYKQKYDAEKLLLIIDGIDEIPQKDGKSIFDILPEEEELDDGIYILVTARTDEEITNFTKEQLCRLDFEDKKIIQKDSQENIGTLKSYIGKYKLANSDIQIKDLIQKADYRILYLNMLKEILLTCKVNLDDIPSNEQIIDFYLQEVKKKYGEKYFQTIFDILIILASQLEELTIKEIAYLNSDSSISLKLIANLFDLRGFIKKTRSENGNKFSLNHILLTHYLNKEFESEIINYLKNIYQDINSFSSEDEADIYKMAYLEQYEKQYGITLSSDLNSDKVLSFILDIKQCEEHKKIKIAILLIDLLLKKSSINIFIASLSQLDSKLLETAIYVKIKDAEFTDFIIQNIDSIVENYQESEYDVFKSLYMNFYKYKDKETAFKLVNSLIKEHEKFEDILNYIAMCKGDGKPIEARNIVDKYLENNNFENSQRAAFYYIVGRSYKDDFKRFEGSKYYFEKSISLYNEQNESTSVDLVTNSLVSYYFKIGEFKKAYDLLLPIYNKAINDKDGRFTSGDIEAIFNNMEIMKLVNNMRKEENVIHSLTSWFPFYYQNTVAIRMVEENNIEKAVNILNDCLKIIKTSDTYLVKAAILYNLYLLDNDISNLEESKNICIEKDYSNGLNIIENIETEGHILNTYTINGKHFWLCDKNVDMLV